MKKYYLGQKYPNTYFTAPEAICMYHLFSGKTYAEISNATGLATNTIIFYINNMRCKLASATKWDLIEKVKETDFVKCLEEIKILALD